MIIRPIFLSHSVENFRRGILYCCIISGSEKVYGQKDEKEYQDVPSKIFCPTVPKISIGNPSCCINFGYRKSLEKRGGGGGVSRFSIESFLSHSAENLRRESFTVALFSGTEKVGIEWAEYHDNPSIFLSHSVENFRRGILYCCIISGSEKVYGQKDEKEYQDVPSKIFCPTVPKISVGNHYCCINFGYRKSLEKRGRGVSRFSIESFLSHSAEKLRRESFTVALVSGTENVWIERGEYQDNPSIFFVSQCRKFR